MCHWYQDVEEGDEVTRNFVETPPVDSLTRDAQMFPWFPVDLTHVDPQQTEPPTDFFEVIFLCVFFVFCKVFGVCVFYFLFYELLIHMKYFRVLN